MLQCGSTLLSHRLLQSSFLEMVVDVRKRWTLRDKHEKLLRHLYEKEAKEGLLDAELVNFQRVIEIEQSLWMKRLKGFSSVGYVYEPPLPEKPSMRMFSLKPQRESCIVFAIKT